VGYIAATATDGLVAEILLIPVESLPLMIIMSPVFISDDTLLKNPPDDIVDNVSLPA
jgi:hypothetical protein